MYHHFLYHLLNTYTPRRQLPVSAQVPESLFVASEAQSFCEKQEIHTAVASCDDKPPFLINIRLTEDTNSFILYWPAWVPLLGGVGTLIIFSIIPYSNS